MTLARRVWNYTCATSTNDSIPVSIGATATLFDASPLIQHISESEFHKIPAILKLLRLSQVESLKVDNFACLSVSVIFPFHDRVPIFHLRPKA